MLKKLTEKQMKQVIEHAGRGELYVNPISYLKAIRVTLINLGYDRQWLAEEFTPVLYEYYDKAFRQYEREKYEKRT